MGTRRHRIAVPIVALMMLTGVGACSKSDSSKTAGSSGSASSGSSGSASTATIKDFKFTPDTIKVKAGSEVTWTNNDEKDHTVSADSGSQKFDSGHLAKGKTFTQKFAQAGTYKYKCDIHTYMTGTVQVS